MPDKPTDQDAFPSLPTTTLWDDAFKQIFDLSPDIIGSVNLDGYFEKVNRAVVDILGYSPAEFCSKPFLQFVHAVDYEKTEKALLSASQGTKIIEIENRYRCKDGSIKWIDWRVWDSGKDNRFLVIGRDITARKQLEALLRNRGRVLETILDNIPVMITFMDQYGNKQLVNQCYQKALACTPEAACKPDIWIELYPDPKERQRVLDLIAASEGIWNKFKTRTLDGRILDTIWMNLALPDGSRIGIGIDTTDSVQIREALTASEQRYETITTAAQDSIFIKNRQRQYTFVNPAMTRLLQCSPEDLLGKTPEQLFEPEFAAIVKEVDDRTFNGETVNEIRNMEINGRKFVFHTVQVPLGRENGKITSISGIVRDITEIVRVQEQKEALESQRRQIQKLEAVGTLAGGIAHDFNNMLGVILGNASYGRSQLNPEDPLYEVLSNIQTGARQAQSLTQQLLTFAKGGEPVKKLTDLNRLIEESARFIIHGGNCGCEFHFSEALWSAKVDPGQIQQAVGNIVLNAAQAMPDGGSITIKTENKTIEEQTDLPLPAGDYVRITIEDQGVGISAKNLSKIFDPYFTTKHQGSGLGLATTFSIIQKHDGHITVQSTVDKGTIFILYLPADRNKNGTTETPAITHCGKGKILVMDDQEQVLKMLKMILTEMGYSTTAATDGQQAIDLYRRAFQAGDPFDLVILDLTIPGGLGGARTIPELLKMDPEVKAVVSSGYSHDPIMAHYADYGFCGVLPKPYTIAQMSELLNIILNPV